MKKLLRLDTLDRKPRLWNLLALTLVMPLVFGACRLMGARTKWYFWPNAAVREFVGLLTGHKKKQTAIFITMLATYILLAIICF